MCAARSVAPLNEVSVADSSGSSYGELLEEKVCGVIFCPLARLVVQPCDLVLHEQPRMWSTLSTVVDAQYVFGYSCRVQSGAAHSRCKDSADVS